MEAFLVLLALWVQVGVGGAEEERFAVPGAGVVQVSQARDLFGDLTVEENLKLGCIIQGDEALGLKQAFDYFPRLSDRFDQQVSTMSGGEQQMVAIGRALMARPQVM